MLTILITIHHTISSFISHTIYVLFIPFKWHQSLSSDEGDSLRNISVLIISSNQGLNSIPVIDLINSATVTYLFFIYLEKKLALKYNYMWYLNQGAGTSPNFRYWYVYNFNLRGPGATSQCYPSRCYPSSNLEFNIYARQQRIAQVWLGFCGPPKWQVGRWNMLPTPQSLNGEWIQSQ